MTSPCSFITNEFIHNYLHTHFHFIMGWNFLFIEICFNSLIYSFNCLFTLGFGLFSSLLDRGYAQGPWEFGIMLLCWLLDIKCNYQIVYSKKYKGLSALFFLKPRLFYFKSNEMGLSQLLNITYMRYMRLGMPRNPIEPFKPNIKLSFV